MLNEAQARLNKEDAKFNAEQDPMELVARAVPLPLQDARREVQGLREAIAAIARGEATSALKKTRTGEGAGAALGRSKTAPAGGQRVSPENRTIDATKSGVRFGGSPNVEET
jgi:hypothetical protein